jgi:hypothetical protein
MTCGAVMVVEVVLWPRSLQGRQFTLELARGCNGLGLAWMADAGSECGIVAWSAERAIVCRSRP